MTNKQFEKFRTRLLIHYPHARIEDRGTGLSFLHRLIRVKVGQLIFQREEEQLLKDAQIDAFFEEIVHDAGEQLVEISEYRFPGLGRALIRLVLERQKDSEMRKLLRQASEEAGVFHLDIRDEEGIVRRVFDRGEDDQQGDSSVPRSQKVPES